MSTIIDFLKGIMTKLYTWIGIGIAIAIILYVIFQQ